LAEYLLQLVVMQLTFNDFQENVNEGYFSLRSDGELQENPIAQSLARKLEPYVDAIPGLSHSHLFALLREAVHFNKHLFLRNSSQDEGELPEDLHLQSESAYPQALTFALLDTALGICEEMQVPVITIFGQHDRERVESISRKPLVLGRYRAGDTEQTGTSRPVLFHRRALERSWPQIRRRCALI